MNALGSMLGLVLIALGFVNGLDDRIIVAAFEIMLGCWLVLHFGSLLLDGDEQ